MTFRLTNTVFRHNSMMYHNATFIPKKQVNHLFPQRPQYIHSKPITLKNFQPIKPIQKDDLIYQTNNLCRKSLPQADEPPFKTIHSDNDLFSLGGYEEILDTVADLVRYLQNPKEYAQIGANPPKGVLLSGPPGVGKTMLAEAVAGHAGVPLVIISGPEIENKYIGESEAKLRRLFEYAEKMAPCVLCIDEIESIAGKRIATDEVSAERQTNAQYINSIVNQLLSLLSQNRPGVVVIGTTNYFERLDPGIVRPGRFDKRIHITLPNSKDRKRILELHTTGKKIGADASLDILTAISGGYSGAKIAGWINEAAVFALRDKSQEINLCHFDAARTIMNIGIPRPKGENAEHNRRIATHEAGHALVGHLLGLKVYKVSICPHGEALGITEFIYSDDAQVLSKQELLKNICMQLAGRAAEKVNNEAGIGSHNDLDLAKSTLEMMVGKEALGSSMLGSVSEIENILQKQMKRAEKLILQNKKTWECIKDNLLERDELLKDDFLAVVRGEKLPDKNTVSENILQKRLSLPPSLKKNQKVNSVQKNQSNFSKQTLPYTLNQVATGLEIPSNAINKIEQNRFGDVEIIFEDNFRYTVKNVRKTLNRFEIRHRVMFGQRSLIIFGENIAKFADFIRKYGGV